AGSQSWHLSNRLRTSGAPRKQKIAGPAWFSSLFVGRDPTWRQPQKLRRSPKRKFRSSARALVTDMKLPRLLIVPSEFNRMLDTFVDGLLKCGVLVKLNASVRNCRFNFSVSGNVRKIERSEFTTLGPRRK